MTGVLTGAAGKNAESIPANVQVCWVATQSDHILLKGLGRRGEDELQNRLL